MTLAARIDAMADAAFPPADRAGLDGWILRADADPARPHRRNNSVWARDGDGDGLAERIAAAEAWYAARGLPARVQITPASSPPGLDDALRDRGYAIENPAGVWIGDLEDLGAPPAPVGIADRPDERWWQLSGADAEVLARVEVPCAYARTEESAARGVLQGDWLGIYEVATVPEARRRGAASTIVAALAAWGIERGATRAYMVVTDANAPARALYARLGFSRAYGYAYRIARV